MIVQARTVQLIYVDNRDYPGGPWQYFLATQNLAINVMFYATLFLLTFLSDILVVCPFYFKSPVSHKYGILALAMLGNLVFLRKKEGRNPCPDVPITHVIDLLWYVFPL